MPFLVDEVLESGNRIWAAIARIHKNPGDCFLVDLEHVDGGIATLDIEVIRKDLVVRHCSGIGGDWGRLDEQSDGAQ